MSSLGYQQAFSKLGARPKNIQWAVSAISSRDHLVVSLWKHYFGRSVDGVLPYTDRLSRLSGPGRKLLREHLTHAYENKMPVEAIVASAQDSSVVDNGGDASEIKKEFYLLENKIGEVAEFDGDQFVIHFRKCVK